jgi:uncharacterized protein (DUF433 family)
MIGRRPGTFGQVSRDPGVLGNAWVIAGTRIPVAAIRRLHEDGYSNDRIIAEYPDLVAADIAAALKHDATEAA